MDGDRPSRPTVEQIRAVVHPPEVTDRANAEHWTSATYLRRVSVYLTALLVRTPISANGVTALMIIAGFSAGPALLIPGIWGPILAVALTQLQMLLDCCDGEVARWRRTSSPRGIFLDQVGHYAAEGSIGLFLGLRAAGFVGGAEPDPVRSWQFACVGALLMAGIWLNKSLNLMVVHSRVNAGLGKLPDVPESRAVPPTSVLGRARRAARFIPFHRLYHSIELSLLTLAVAVLTIGWVDRLVVDQVFVVVMAAAIWVVIVGHVTAIWLSRRLDP